MTDGSEYQKLRSHLAFLRMTAAAEALPGELDHAIKAKLTHQGFLERLLSLEVDSVEQRRRAGLLRFAALPSRSSFPTSTSRPSRRSTRS